MTRYTTRLSDDAYDLGRIFIGHQHQLDLFNIYLTRWRQLLLHADSDLDPPIKTAPSSNHKTNEWLLVILFRTASIFRRLPGDIPLASILLLRE